LREKRVRGGSEVVEVRSQHRRIHGAERAMEKNKEKGRNEWIDEYTQVDWLSD
jgi:hypothetical protein